MPQQIRGHIQEKKLYKKRADYSQNQSSVSTKVTHNILDIFQSHCPHQSIYIQEKHIITHTKKTTLYKDGNPWEKKSSDFDVTRKLVGLYLLSQLQHLAMNVGLCRDSNT